MRKWKRNDIFFSDDSVLVLVSREIILRKRIEYLEPLSYGYFSASFNENALNSFWIMMPYIIHQCFNDLMAQSENIKICHNLAEKEKKYNNNTDIALKGKIPSFYWNRIKEQGFKLLLIRILKVTDRKLKPKNLWKRWKKDVNKLQIGFRHTSLTWKKNCISSAGLEPVSHRY